MDHWTINTCIERARERQAAMEREIKRQQLLRELADSTEHFVFFRKMVLFTGNLLIATGLWLKRRAGPTQSRSHLPTMAGRFS